MRTAALAICVAAMAVMPGVAQAQTNTTQTASSDAPVDPAAQHCQALANPAANANAHLSAVQWHEAGLVVDMGRGAKSDPLPAHCEVSGILNVRDGTLGQHYAIRFHLRLPAQWNRRFFFQGGGGSDGDVGSAVGPTGDGNPLALVKGYAVVSQDAGHDNALNNDPTHGGNLVFGFDPQARTDYGYASLKPSYDAARTVVLAYYGAAPVRSYYFGCSKGGQEGMEFAHRWPDAFDGIVAGAPGFALPRAALAEAWDVQSFAHLAAAQTGAPATVATIGASFSPADFVAVRGAVLDACDALDGLKDGIVADFRRCTTALVMPELRARLCARGATADCLSADKITALTRVIGGAHDAAGHALYAPWIWDTGVGDMGWSIWKTGIPGRVPALNIMLGGGSLAAVFTTPPTPLGADPAAALAFQLGFDLRHGARKITATDADFKTSAWDDMQARSPDLSAFAKAGGRMIVPHGVSDPVFSVNDTLAWWGEVNKAMRGRAGEVVRVFPVPGMTHCGGGPATDRFDAFSALVGWVEHGAAPDAISASAGAATPWPGRSRPLCAWPAVARYKGAGDVERADSFSCVAPRRKG